MKLILVKGEETKKVWRVDSYWLMAQGWKVEESQKVSWTGLEKKQIEVLHEAYTKEKKK